MSTVPMGIITAVRDRSPVLKACLGLCGWLMLMIPGQARAAVVYSGVLDLPIATGFEGTYFDIETAQGSASTITGWDINFFFCGIGAWNQPAFQPVRGTTDPFAAIINLNAGTLIGAGSVFASGEGGSGDEGSEHVGLNVGQFVPGEEGLIGFKLINGESNYYGWMRVTFTVDESGAFVHDWAYDTSGAPILAGYLDAIPEPGRASLLALGIFSLIMRRRRPRRPLSMPGLLLLGMMVATEVPALDSDADGLSDVFQRVHGLPSGPGVALNDSDGNGIADAIEFLFGTNPNNPASIPPVKPQLVPSGVYQLRQLVPGALYGLETSDDLQNWTEAVAPSSVQGSEMTMTPEGHEILGAPRFYRFFAPTSQPDEDNDGLNVIEEHLLGTSDLLADTDLDGITDADEFLADTDPLDFFNGIDPVLVIIAGDAQLTPSSQWTLNALVVEARKPNGEAWPQAPVTFESEDALLALMVNGIGSDSVRTRADSAGRASAHALMPGLESNQVRIHARCGAASVEFVLQSGPPNGPPLVRFVTPDPGLLHQEGVPLSLEVSAVDEDPGDTVQVQIFQRGASLVAAQPGTEAGMFEAVWSAPEPGQRILLARATDNYGNESWAALPVSIKAIAQDNLAYGPVEGGHAAALLPETSELRSNPFLRQPVFAAAIGGVNGAELSFDEQPDWPPGAFQSGYFVYMRSGNLRGALLQVNGNSAHALTLDSAVAGIAVGDKVALIPKWTLQELLPGSAVHENSQVYLSVNHGPPLESGIAYQKGVAGSWTISGQTEVVNPFIEPWDCFTVLHPAASASSLLIVSGDAASGPRRFLLPAHSTPRTLAVGLLGPLSSSLRESGLADSGWVRDTISGHGDVVTVHEPAGPQSTWNYTRKNWQPETGVGDGATPLLFLGGGLLIERGAADSETQWVQPAGK